MDVQFKHERDMRTYAYISLTQAIESTVSGRDMLFWSDSGDVYDLICDELAPAIEILHRVRDRLHAQINNKEDES